MYHICTAKENQMNWDQVKGNWTEVKGKVREKWGRLTDDDLDIIKGEQQQLEGILMKRYGKPREQIQIEVEDFITTCECN